MNDRFQRTSGIISLEVQALLADKHVLVAGVGGAGGQVAVDLTRMGLGYLTLADFDVYETHNANRQVGCFDSTIGKPKIDVVGGMCRDVNPEVRLRNIPDGVTADNVEELVAPTDGFPAPDFVIEVIDLAGVPAKIDLHRACRERGLVVMTGVMTGFGATLHTFSADAPSYDALYITPDGNLDFHSIVPHIGSYVIPEYVERCFAGEGHAPTCVVGAVTASAMMVSEIMRGILLGPESMVVWPEYTYIDFFDHAYIRKSFEPSPAGATPSR